MSIFDKWRDKITHLVETRVELVKLSIIESASKAMSYFIFILICIFITSTILVLLGFGIGEYFADVTGSRACGFLIATGIYAVLFAFMMLFRKKLSTAFSGIFIRILTDEDDEKDNDKELP
jgi:hypothetical protein